MAINNRYYTNTNFLTIVYSVDYILIEHFANMFFNGDKSRIIYSSDEYAFRKRANQNEGNLNLPFMNFYMVNYDPGERTRWNVNAYATGLFIPELQTKVRFAPIQLDYEASFWTHTNYDINYAFSEFVWDTDNKTILKPWVNIQEQEVAFPAHLSYDGLDFNPQYKENDWLERNKIHSASADFTVETLALKVNENISIPEEVVFNFAYSQGIEEGSFDEVYTKLIDHINETTIEQ